MGVGGFRGVKIFPTQKCKKSLYLENGASDQKNNNTLPPLEPLYTLSGEMRNRVGGLVEGVFKGE